MEVINLAWWEKASNSSWRRVPADALRAESGFGLMRRQEMV
jgi:hypothetical protein